jgi:hypothetical protein
MSLESIKARNLRAFTSTYRSRVVSILIFTNGAVVDRHQMSIDRTCRLFVLSAHLSPAVFTPPPHSMPTPSSLESV